MPIDVAPAPYANPRFLFPERLLGQERDKDLVEPTDEFADGLQPNSRVGRHESTVSHFGEPVRQNVLKIAPHELEDLERADPPFLFAGALITEGDLAVPDPDDPVRCDGDAEDVLRQILDRPLAVADVAAVEFTTLLPQFNELNATVLGVSDNSIQSHCDFIAKHQLQLTLLSDPNHEVMDLYGAWVISSLGNLQYGRAIRTTLIIDPTGVIRHFIPEVMPQGHAERILKKLAALQASA